MKYAALVNKIKYHHIILYFMLQETSSLFFPWPGKKYVCTSNEVKVKTMKI